MLKRHALILFMVALMLALPVVTAASPAVEFKDDNLKAAVIEEFANLGRVVEVTKVPQADMRLLKQLFAEGIYAAGINNPPNVSESTEVIRNLSGLEYALNLKSLDLRGGNIKDLAPIRNLPLNFLDIRGNDRELVGTEYQRGTPAFSYNPSSPQMKILQEIQHRGAVVRHDGLVSRISGPDRYQTAVRIWQNMYNQQFDDFPGSEDFGKMLYTPGNTIVLARGDDFADALVGAPLAYDLGAPILLTTSNRLHPATKSALVNYVEKFEDVLTGEFDGVFDVYVLGGTAAISEAVVNELIYAIETEFDALDVRAIRVGGADRYATSVAIAKKLGDLHEGDEVIFASGENFPDALSAAPYAAAGEIPILLTRSSGLPDSVTDYLKDMAKDATGEEGLNAVVAGGAAAVSENVLSQLNKLKFRAGGKDLKVFDEITRVWGADRYATAVELGKQFGRIKNDKILVCQNGNGDGNGFHAFGQGWSQQQCNDLMYVATGEDFADALTGAPLAALNDTGILLVNKDALPGSVQKVIDFQDKKAGEGTAKLTILGGEAAVTLNNAVKMYNLVRYPAWAPR